MSATVDSWVLRQLRDMRTDIAFVGTNAFSLSHGLSAPDAAEAAVRGAMVESARLIVLLADHTKFGQEAMFRYADLRAIDVLLPTTGMSESDARCLMTVGTSKCCASERVRSYGFSASDERLSHVEEGADGRGDSC